MRRFLIKISSLSVVVLLVCFLLSELEFSDAFIIEKTKDTAFEKVAWNINLINNNSEQIKGSTIFLGSSLVQGGINDSLLNAKGFKTINMGVPHNGNEIPLYFLNRLKDKKPKEVIILKGNTPFQSLHKMTPLLYTSSQIFSFGQSINLDYVRFLFKKTKLALEYMFYKNASNTVTLDLFKKKYGVIFDEHTISEETYESWVNQNLVKKGDEYYNLYQNGFLYNKEKNANTVIKRLKIFKRKTVYHLWSKNNFLTNIDSQENYIKTSYKICNTKGIQFSKIYIPKLIDVNNYMGYKRNTFKQTETDYLGVIFFKDYNFLKKRNHWADADHIDESGANLFTLELMNYLVK